MSILSKEQVASIANKAALGPLSVIYRGDSARSWLIGRPNDAEHLHDTLLFKVTDYASGSDLTSLVHARLREVVETCQHDRRALCDSHEALRAEVERLTREHAQANEGARILLSATHARAEAAEAELSRLRGRIKSWHDALCGPEPIGRHTAGLIQAEMRDAVAPAAPVTEDDRKWAVDALRAAEGGDAHAGGA